MHYTQQRATIDDWLDLTENMVSPHFDREFYVAAHLVQKCNRLFMIEEFLWVFVLNFAFICIGVHVKHVIYFIILFFYRACVYVYAWVHWCCCLMLGVRIVRDLPVIDAEVLKRHVQGPTEISVMGGKAVLWLSYYLEGDSGERAYIAASDVDGYNSQPRESGFVPSGPVKESPMDGSVRTYIDNPVGCMKFSVRQADGTLSGSSMCFRAGRKASRGYPPKRAHDYLIFTVHQWDDIITAGTGKFNLTAGGSTIELCLKDFDASDKIRCGTCQTEDVVMLRGPVINTVFTKLGVKMLSIPVKQPVGRRATVFGACAKTGRILTSSGLITYQPIFHQHKCSTEGGFSGSPVVTDDGVVGVHTGGLGVNVYNEATNLRHLIDVLDCADAQKTYEPLINSFFFKTPETPLYKHENHLEWLEELRAQRAEEAQFEADSRQDDEYESRFDYGGDEIDVQSNSTSKTIKLGRGLFPKAHVLKNRTTTSYRENVDGFAVPEIDVKGPSLVLATKKVAFKPCVACVIPTVPTKECGMTAEPRPPVLLPKKSAVRVETSPKGQAPAAVAPTNSIKEPTKLTIKPPVKVSIQSPVKESNTVVDVCDIVTCVGLGCNKTHPVPTLVVDKPPMSQPIGIKTPSQKKAARKKRAAEAKAQELWQEGEGTVGENDTMELAPCADVITQKLETFQVPSEDSGLKAERTLERPSTLLKSSSDISTPVLTKTSKRLQSKRAQTSVPEKVPIVNTSNETILVSPPMTGPPCQPTPSANHSSIAAELTSLKQFSPEVLEMYVASLRGNTRRSYTQEPHTRVQSKGGRGKQSSQSS